MTPKQLTPKQRIARIRRWIERCGQMCPEPYHPGNPNSEPTKDYEDRIERASALFGAEIEWLAAYATDLETQLENRRVVEEWQSASAPGSDERSLRLTYYGPGHQEPERFDIELWDGADQVFTDYNGTTNEAFAKAAEWARNNSGKEQ